MPKDSAAMESDGEDEELLMAASAWASAAQNGSESDDDSGGEAAAVPDPKIRKPDSNWQAGKAKVVKHKPAAAEHGASAPSSAKDAPATKPQHEPPAQQSYSLHLTKVPYDATQVDIRCAFGEKGCHVKSVRLVYDRDQKTGEKHFRGVAFVDLADERSFKKGLEFNNTRFLGKKTKVNVRPTRTKRELSEIVKRTEEKVANLIARSKENAASKKRERDDGGDDADAKDEGRGDKKKQKKKKRKSADGPGNKQSPNDGAGDKSDAPAKHANKTNNAKTSPGKQKGKEKPKSKGKERHGKPKRMDEKGNPIKLTKKERAKKAAVIRMMKMKGKKR